MLELPGPMSPMSSINRREVLKNALLWTASAWAIDMRALAAQDIGARERAAMAGLAETFRTKYGVPGLSVAVAHRGQLVYEEAFGMSDTERGEAATPSHLFRIASVSKPITACAIMDLVESGRLKLEDRVFGRGGVLGTDYGRTPYGPNIENITIEHLLTHSSGGWPNDATDPTFRNPAMNRTELISWTLDSMPLATPPGQSYAYSNFGYLLLGRVIEVATRSSYEHHVHRRILSRCAIQDMAIAGNTLADRMPREVRYYGQGGENPYRVNVRRSDANGGWIATARDLIAFMTHIDGFTTTPNILRADTIARMVTPSAANRGYAKGWFINRVNNWWHNGTLAGTQTILVRTASGFCWAALANTRRKDSDMGSAPDAMMWDMVRQVSVWRP
jgi:CubicO group peptidase (beta-lactamase class C family)